MKSVPCCTEFGTPDAVLRDVIRNEIVEEDVADIDPVIGREVVIDLADCERRLRLGGNVGRLGESQPRGISRRDRHNTRARQVALCPLDSGEVERAILNDRPAVIGGEDVHLGRWLDVGSREERQLHHRLPLEPIACLALQSIAARWRDRVVHQPHRLTELGRVSAGDDFYLTDHDLGHRHLPEAGAILFGIVVAVDLIVHAQQRAVGGQARYPELLRLEADDAGLEERQVVRVSRSEWKRLDLGRRQRPPLFDLAEVDDGDIGAHRDRLGHGADCELHVDNGNLPR